MSLRTTTALVVACAAMAIPTVAGAATPDRPDPPTAARTELARTQSGWVRGRVDGDHVTFAGVPYAAPPIGERRWAAPAAPPRWHGVRDATEPADMCPQMGPDANDEPAVIGSEDCLYLNVTVPRDRSPRDRLPVLVWIHGGGLVSGAGSQYDGARLAVEGGLMVVTINYRLGALGFLSSGLLDAPDGVSGNYGIQDQIAALRWVQQNAARFGGDPSNVTIAGQSAGARSVCVHLASPMSQGLFHRAILQSGACANPVATKAVADQRGEQAIAELGCAGMPDVPACLRDRPAADLVTALRGVGAPINDRISDDPWGPVAGTPMLPVQPIDAIAAGAAAGVPLLIGSTRDEMRSFVGFRYDAVDNPLTEDDYRTIIADTFGNYTAAVLERYPAAAYPSPAVAFATVLTDWGGSIGACPVLRTAQIASRHTPVFAYEFSENSIVVKGFPLGAYHSWDLHFLWDVSIPGSSKPDLTAEQQTLGKQMRGYWSAFAHTGDPNGDSRPPWPAFNGPQPVLALGTAAIGPTPFADTHHCDFWANE